MKYRPHWGHYQLSDRDRTIDIRHGNYTRRPLLLPRSTAVLRPSCASLDDQTDDAVFVSLVAVPLARRDPQRPAQPVAPPRSIDLVPCDDAAALGLRLALAKLQDVPRPPRRRRRAAGLSGRPWWGRRSRPRGRRRSPLRSAFGAAREAVGVNCEFAVAPIASACIFRSPPTSLNHKLFASSINNKLSR